MIQCSDVCAGADEHIDLRQDHERPDATRTTAATARHSHGNSGAASAADTSVDNQHETSNQRLLPTNLRQTSNEERRLKHSESLDDSTVAQVHIILKYKNIQ